MDLAVFCYNRPAKLKMCLDMIDLSYIDRLWIFCDAAKRKEDIDLVNQTLKVAKQFDYKNKAVIKREVNYGTPKNVIEGLDQVFEVSSRCMVLEDDCIVRPEAYAFVSQSLDQYKDNKNIFSINTMAPLGPFLNKILTTIIRDEVIACRRVYAFWGWATWADRWSEFRPDLEPFKNPYAKAQNVPLSVGGHVKSTLIKYELGLVGGWDARLLTLTYHKRRLHVHPCHSMMRNIGFDGSGQHYSGWQNVITESHNLGFSSSIATRSKCIKIVRGSKVSDFLMVMEIYVRELKKYILYLITNRQKMNIKKILFRNKSRFSRF